MYCEGEGQGGRVLKRDLRNDVEAKA
mgnify:CR=1